MVLKLVLAASVLSVELVLSFRGWVCVGCAGLGPCVYRVAFASGDINREVPQRYVRTGTYYRCNCRRFCGMAFSGSGWPSTDAAKDDGSQKKNACRAC